MPQMMPQQNAINPMNLFNSQTNPQQQQQLAALNILLGGLGRAPAAKPIAPGLAQPPPQPAAAPQRPVLGGVKPGGNPMPQLGLPQQILGGTRNG